MGSDNVGEVDRRHKLPFEVSDDVDLDFDPKFLELEEPFENETKLPPKEDLENFLDTHYDEVGLLQAVAQHRSRDRNSNDKLKTILTPEEELELHYKIKLGTRGKVDFASSAIAQLDDMNWVDLHPGAITVSEFDKNSPLAIRGTHFKLLTPDPDYPERWYDVIVLDEGKSATYFKEKSPSSRQHFIETHTLNALGDRAAEEAVKRTYPYVHRYFAIVDRDRENKKFNVLGFESAFAAKGRARMRDKLAANRQITPAK